MTMTCTYTDALPQPADKKVWMNGQLVPAGEAAVSVFDHGLLYGDGVFEGIRIYNGRILKLQTHLERLELSARAIRLPMPYSLDELAAACRETCRVNGLTDGYIRLCVTRGMKTLGLDAQICEHGMTFIIAATIQLYPEELYETGLSVITSSVIRNHPSSLSPRIKSMNYLNNILAKIEATDAGVPEAVMLNPHGYVAECTGDNIFIVRRFHGETTLLTPPLHAGMLEGVTMNIVIDLARKAGITFQYMDLTKHDLYTADEMFLTGTAAEVIPVTEIDKRPVGTGKPGTVTTQLIEAFRELVKHAPED